MKPGPPAPRKRPGSRNAGPSGPRHNARSGVRAAYRLTLEYEGTRFQGWQRQGEGQQAQGVRTVANTLERLLGEAGLRVLTLGGSGRTDAGVHALAQVAHLHLPADQAPAPKELQRLFDQALPVDIAVAKVEPCDPGFHSRHDALSRSYLYQLSRRRSGLHKPYIWWVKAPLDLASMQQAWASFEGFHDFSAFADLEDEDPRCEVQRCEFLEEGGLILLRVTASHFLRKQVRRMVGAAVACGLHKARPEQVLRDLEAPRPDGALRWSDQAAAASGLFLESVQYPGGPGVAPLRSITRVG